MNNCGSYPTDNGLNCILGQISAIALQLSIFQISISSVCNFQNNTSKLQSKDTSTNKPSQLSKTQSNPSRIRKPVNQLVNGGPNNSLKSASAATANGCSRKATESAENGRHLMPVSGRFKSKEVKDTWVEVITLYSVRCTKVKQIINKHSVMTNSVNELKRKLKVLFKT